VIQCHRDYQPTGAAACCTPSTAMHIYKATRIPVRWSTCFKGAATTSAFADFLHSMNYKEIIDILIDKIFFLWEKETLKCGNNYELCHQLSFDIS